MAKRVILHIAGEDPIMGEVEKLPDPTDTSLTVANVRRVDGKEVAYITEGVELVVFPWHRITFMEVMGGEKATDKVIGFFR